MSEAGGGAPAAAGKAEGAADVPGAPVPESGVEAADGRKGGDAEGSAGAVGWGPEAEEVRAKDFAEFWGDEALGGVRGGGEPPAAVDGGEAAGPAEGPVAGAPGPEAVPGAEAATTEAGKAGAAGEGAAAEARVPGTVAAARAVEGAAPAAETVGPVAEGVAPVVAGEAPEAGGEETGTAAASAERAAGEGAGGNVDEEVPAGGAESVAAPAEPGPVVGAGQERGAAEADAPGEEPKVLELLAAVKVTVEGVADAVLDLAMGSGAVREELGEITGKLDAAVAAGGKVRSADWESVAQKVGEVREDIYVLRGLVEGHGELLKQGGKAQGESGEDNFKSQLTAMLKKSLDRVDERIKGLVEQGNKQSEAFEGVKLDVGVVKEVGASVGSLDERLQAYKEDLSRDRELLGGRRRWAALGLAGFVAPALVLAGAFVGQQWEVLPLEESTGGWKDHVWERYGLDLVECVKTGVRQGGPYDCTVDVGASVDQVRRASGR